MTTTGLAASALPTASTPTTDANTADNLMSVSTRDEGPQIAGRRYCSRDRQNARWSADPRSGERGYLGSSAKVDLPNADPGHYGQPHNGFFRCSMRTP